MSDSIEYCKDCPANVGCHLARKCLELESEESPASSCYALYSGWVKSKNDGDWHRITFTDLVRLYRLDPRLCFDGYDEDKWHGRSRQEVVELHPRQDGNYSLHNGGAVVPLGAEESETNVEGAKL